MEFTSRQLRAFVLVAKHRSFARAADALFITPSGLSLLIRELETHVGCRLFDRTTRTVSLTARGDELQEVASRSLHDLDATLAHIGRAASESRQVISIGAPPLLACEVLPAAIKAFHEQRPEFRVQLVDASLTALMHGVVTGALDVAIGSFGRAADVRRVPLFQSSLMVIRPEREPARATTTWAALNGERLIALPADSPLQKLIDGHVARSRIVLRTSMVLNLLETVIAMVEAGHGSAIIPSFGVPACRNRRVVMSRLVNPVAVLEHHLIRSRARKLPSGANDLATFLQAYIGQWMSDARVV